MRTALFLLLSASATFAQVVPGRYILELSGDPAAAVVQPRARSSERSTAIATRRTAVRQLQASARTAVAQHGGSATNLNMLLAMPNAIYMETSGARKLVNGEMLAPEEPGMSSEPRG